MRGACVLKNSCVARIADYWVRGDLWIHGCIDGNGFEAVTGAEYIMNVSEVKFLNTLEPEETTFHAIFETWYHLGLAYPRAFG